MKISKNERHRIKRNKKRKHANKHSNWIESKKKVIPSHFPFFGKGLGWPGQ